MKWPNTLTVIRHGESAYNELKEKKEADPEYIEFKRAYNRRKKDPETARKLAEKLVGDRRLLLGVGDHDTPLTDKGHWQAKTTGSRLSEIIDLPDVVFVSPYLRTRQTLGGLAAGWPELGEVRVVEEERVREQEHGLSILYNDWRIFHVLHPEQDLLRAVQGPYWYRYPQGENVPDIRERDRSMLGTYTRDYSEQNVMTVTHHLSILSLRANLERLNEDGFENLNQHHKPVNCGATVYEGNPDVGQDGHLELKIYNQQLY